MQRFSLYGLVLLTLFLTACASGPTSEQTPGPASYAAFLTYPDRLQPVPGDDGAYRWAAPDANLGRYNKVLLDPIQVQLASDAEYKAIDPAQLKTLVDGFRQALVKALGDAYPVVTQPGSGVLQ